MSERRGYAWDDDRPPRSDELDLGPLRRVVGNSQYVRHIGLDEPDRPQGEFLDKVTGA
jgi:hypothetical protein